MTTVLLAIADVANHSRSVQGRARLRGCAVLLLAVSACDPACGSEGGGTSYLPGFYGDFGMAYLPESGTYFNNLFGYYTAKTDHSDYSVAFDLPSLLHVSDWEVLGGRYTVGIYPMLLRSEYVDNDAGIDSRRGGAGDFYVLPAGIVWQWESLYLFAYEGVVLPTGSYRKGRDLNAGRNYWTSDSNLAMTWLINEGQFELSLNLGYMVNSENPATDYRTGDEVHLDYLLGYYPLPEFGLGITGSFYRQVTADSGPGAEGVVLQSEAHTIGPALYYNQKVGDQEIMWSVKWLHEFNVNSYAPGEYIMMHTVLKF